MPPVPGVPGMTLPIRAMKIRARQRVMQKGSYRAVAGIETRGALAHPEAVSGQVHGKIENRCAQPHGDLGTHAARPPFIPKKQMAPTGQHKNPWMVVNEAADAKRIRNSKPRPAMVVRYEKGIQNHHKQEHREIPRHLERPKCILNVGQTEPDDAHYQDRTGVSCLPR